MYWTLILVTLLPVNNRPPDGTYSTYQVISQHDDRANCEEALYSFARKYTPKNDKQSVACIKTDTFFKRLATSTSGSH